MNRDKAMLRASYTWLNGAMGSEQGFKAGFVSRLAKTFWTGASGPRCGGHGSSPRTNGRAGLAKVLRTHVIVGE